MNVTKVKIDNNPWFICWIEKKTKPLEMMIGLIGRRNIKDNQIMIFEFPDFREWDFHTKMVRFNLDVIGLNKNMKVIDIKKDIKRGVRFKIKGFYVIEAKSGFINRNKIKENSKILIRNYEKL